MFVGHIELTWGRMLRQRLGSGQAGCWWGADVPPGLGEGAVAGSQAGAECLCGAEAPSELGAGAAVGLGKRLGPSASNKDFGRIQLNPSSEPTPGAQANLPCPTHWTT